MLKRGENASGGGGHMAFIDKALGTMTANTPVSLECDFEPKYVVVYSGKGGSSNGLYLWEWDIANDATNTIMTYYVGDTSMTWKRTVSASGRFSKSGNTVSYTPINSIYAGFALRMIAFG